MNVRTLLRTLGLLVMVSLGLVVLGVMAVAAWYLIGLMPVKVSVAGRVVDSAGCPITNASVEAMALPIHSAYSEAAIEPPGKRRHLASSDAAGYFQMKRVSIGVNAADDKGGYVQEYMLVVSADGYRALAFRLSRNPGRKERRIMLGDIVLQSLSVPSEVPATLP